MANINEILMPFMLLDIQNQLYDEYIKPLDVRHAAKKYRNRWASAYGRCNASLVSDIRLSALRKGIPSDAWLDANDEMVAIFDEFAEYLMADVVKLRYACETQMMYIPQDKRMIIAQTMCCNILSQMACKICILMQGNFAQFIVPLIDNTHRFANAYYPSPDVVNFNANEQVSLAIKVIVNKIKNFKTKLRP